MGQITTVPQPSRRDVLVGMAAAFPLLLPMRKAAATPLQSFSHGEFEITVFSDGYLTLGGEVLMPDAEDDVRQTMLARLGGDSRAAPVQANVPLIRVGEDLILVDTGAGVNFQLSTGRLAENLATAGVDRNAITKVVFTHAHPDHSGGTVLSDGNLMFPNAQYFIGLEEWDFWTDKAFESHMPTALHDFARGAQRDLFAVENRISRLMPGDEIVPGMRIVATPGHTPGHVSIELEGPEPLIIVGDACTNDVIFFEHPNWRFGFDVDADLALKTRQALLDRAAAEKIKVFGYHWSHPGPGYVDRKDGGYQFVPA